MPKVNGLWIYDSEEVIEGLWDAIVQAQEAPDWPHIAGEIHAMSKPTSTFRDHQEMILKLNDGSRWLIKAIKLHPDYVVHGKDRCAGCGEPTAGHTPEDYDEDGNCLMYLDSPVTDYQARMHERRQMGLSNF